jgi:leader peptidase (prepilin peptidase)/N-methyltransferase
VILISIIFGIVGLIIGSFITAVVHRLNDLESLVRGRSQCPKCKKQLGFWDLIPLLSFIFLEGKCRYCKQKISITYPLIELLTAIIFVLIYQYFGISVYSIFLLIITISLIVIAFYDIQKMLIPDEIVIFTAIIVIIYFVYSSVVGKNFDIILMQLIGAAIFGGVLALLYLFSKGKWIGFGDIKLTLLLGFITGYPLVFVGFFMSFLLGGIYGLILIALGKKEMNSKVPFAPLLILGTYIAIFWGDKILNWYLKIGVR